MIDVSFLDGNIAFILDRDGVAFIDTESWGACGVIKGSSESENDPLKPLGGPRSGELAIARTIILRLANEVEPYLQPTALVAMYSAYYLILSKANLEIITNIIKAKDKSFIATGAAVLCIAVLAAIVVASTTDIF